jgi:hypothetical protein
MAIGFNSIRASDSRCRGRKRDYAMSIERLFDAVERRGDIGWRVAALVLPISNRPRVTPSCASKIGLREPGEHTSGPNLASRDNVAHNQTLYTILETPPRSSRSVERRPGHTLSDGHMLVGVARMLAQSCRRRTSTSQQ